MQEFVYYSPDKLDFPLDESIFVTTDKSELNTNEFLVSNTQDIKSEVISKEINFYIKNSKDPFPQMMKTVPMLYDMVATQYDNSEEMEYTKDIQNKVLVIGTKNEIENFLMKTEENQFDLYDTTEDKIVEISGHIGNLKVLVKSEKKDVLLQVDQIVWFDAKEEGLKQSGTFDPNLTSIEETIQMLQNNINEYIYKKYISYDSSSCQYHERREETCAKCVEVCPTTAIVKNSESKHLEFSDIDCVGCGGCVSVCPTASIDYTLLNKDSIYEISYFYNDRHPLIIPSKMQIENLTIDLKENVLPLAIQGEKFLDEASFITLTQMSGSQVIFYSDFLSKGTKDAIDILNAIYQKKYSKDAILVAKNKEELQFALDEVSFIENSKFNTNQRKQRKRETFSFRLQHLVGDEDLGVVKTGEHIHYSKVEVNESNCTLCLSCVGACNVDALVADPKDNTLRINPSLCTSCGYCEVSCPEKECLTIKRDEIELNPTWFKEQILAKDTLFACVECGVEFAATKSVEKIANMMAPVFAADPVKLRTLYCCENCKAKLMIKQGLLNG